MPDRAQFLAARYRALLEVMKYAGAQRETAALLETLASRLQPVAHFDLLALALHDPGRNTFRYRLYRGSSRLDTPAPFETYAEEAPAGVVWSTQRPWIRADIETEPHGMRLLALLGGYGVRSVCALPLATVNRRLGVLALCASQVAAYADSEVEFLELVAGVVATAADSALAYSQLAESQARLNRERLYLEEEIRAGYYWAEVVPASSAWQRVMREIDTVAPTDSTVLIRCEAGCEAELAARAIHDRSRRKERAFIRVNCAEPGGSRLESELFGGAGRVARVELADGGTLFLEHVGCLPAEVQARLLRLLQQREFECPLRGRRIPADVRLVAATNCDLASLVAARQFRSDLFYRINVLPLTLPPLRERQEDIPQLARYFARRFARRLNRPVGIIPAEAMEDLVRRPWPGNTRELENLVERAVLVSSGPELEIAASGPVESADVTLAEADRAHILRALAACRWRVGGPNGAAARLGMKRTTLQSRMRKLGIERRSVFAAAE